MIAIKYCFIPFFIVLLACRTNGITEDWMKFLPNNLPFNEMSMPGAHDSGSRFDNKQGTRKTQVKTIRQLLDFGIRYLDIRCVAYFDPDRQINYFRIYHDKKFMKLSFGQVLNQVTSFLTSNPSETVVMKIKEEIKSPKLSIPDAQKPKKSFESIMDDYFGSFKYSGFFWNPIIETQNQNPTLGQLRGKILILQKFPSMPPNRFGLKWFQASRVQDKFDVKDVKEKQKFIEDAIKKGKAIKINALNGVVKPKKGRISFTPKEMADKINPSTVRLLKRFPPPPYVGIMPIDFPSEDLVKSIIRIAICPATSTSENVHKDFCS